MEIQTSSFGTQSVSKDDLITFPRGMIGFEDYTEFKLFHEEGEQPTVYWLQSTSDADFMMSIISPSVLGLDYQIQLDDEDMSTIGIESADDAIIVLVIYNQSEPGNDNIDVKAIAKAPIVINIKTKKALQKSLTKLDVNS